MAIFTHVTVGTNNLEKARQFYDAVLAPLGLKRLKDFGDGGSCWGQTSEEFMVLKPANGQPATHANGGTIGFTVASQEQGNAWHKAGVAHGGKSIEDPPGIRQGSAGPIYLAYLRDPDGNKLCALHRMPAA